MNHELLQSYQITQSIKEIMQKHAIFQKIMQPIKEIKQKPRNLSIFKNNKSWNELWGIMTIHFWEFRNRNLKWIASFGY